MIILTITHFAELLLDHSRQLFLYFSFFNTADSKLNLVENHSIICTRKGRIEIVDLWTAQCPILNSLRRLLSDSDEEINWVPQASRPPVAAPVPTILSSKFLLINEILCI